MEIPENLKTVDGIVAAMREEAKRLLESTGSDEGFSYMADLLEAAVKRERDLASLRAIHAVEMAERDARRELDAAVLNKDFLDSAKYLVEVAARTGAGRQDMDGRKAGNAAKLRAAAEDMERFLGRHQPNGFLWAASEPQKGPDELWAEFCEIDVRMEAALDSPARNCDRGREAAEDAFTAKFGRPWTEEEARVAEWLFEEEGRTGTPRQDADGRAT